jgi:putative dehydrogenase
MHTIEGADEPPHALDEPGESCSDHSARSARAGASPIVFDKMTQRQSAELRIPMKPTIAIYAQGSMGAALAAQLTRHGITVLTDLEGRSAESRARALAAGMTPVSREDLVRADILMSVLPPGLASRFAASLAPELQRRARKPLFVDCNAVSPDTVRSMADRLTATGADFLDVGIIGPPPRHGAPAPRLYAAGAKARVFAELNEYGLDVRILGGTPGTASALKMAYGGITKGLICVSAAMLLGGSRGGVASALAQELASSEPDLFASLSRRVPDMLPKAYRWVAEMEEISHFVDADAPAAALYRAAAQFYERIAADAARHGPETTVLESFFK